MRVPVAASEAGVQPKPGPQPARNRSSSEAGLAMGGAGHRQPTQPAPPPTSRHPAAAASPHAGAGAALGEGEDSDGSYRPGNSEKTDTDSSSLPGAEAEAHEELQRLSPAGPRFDRRHPPRIPAMHPNAAYSPGSYDGNLALAIQRSLEPSAPRQGKHRGGGLTPLTRAALAQHQADQDARAGHTAPHHHRHHGRSGPSRSLLPVDERAPTSQPHPATGRPRLLERLHRFASEHRGRSAASSHDGSMRSAHSGSGSQHSSLSAGTTHISVTTSLRSARSGSRHSRSTGQHIHVHVHSTPASAPVATPPASVAPVPPSPPAAPAAPAAAAAAAAANPSVPSVLEIASVPAAPNSSPDAAAQLPQPTPPPTSQLQLPAAAAPISLGYARGAPAHFAKGNNRAWDGQAKGLAAFKAQVRGYIDQQAAEADINHPAARSPLLLFRALNTGSWAPDTRFARWCMDEAGGEAVEGRHKTRWAELGGNPAEWRGQALRNTLGMELLPSLPHFWLATAEAAMHRSNTGAFAALHDFRLQAGETALEAEERFSTLASEARAPLESQGEAFQAGIMRSSYGAPWQSAFESGIQSARRRSNPNHISVADVSEALQDAQTAVRLRPTGPASAALTSRAAHAHATTAPGPSATPQTNLINARGLTPNEHFRQRPPDASQWCPTHQTTKHGEDDCWRFTELMAKGDVQAAARLIESGQLAATCVGQTGGWRCTTRSQATWAPQGPPSARCRHGPPVLGQGPG